MNRNLIVYLVVSVFVMSAAAIAYAAVPVPGASAPTASASPMTPEEAAKLRQQVQQLSVALGNPPPPKKEDHKTVGDVADKALDIFSGMVGTVSQSLKKIAPEVWRIMIRQQYAKAIAGIVTPIVLMIGLLVGLFSWRKKLRPIDDDSSDVATAKIVGSVLMRIAIACCIIWLAVTASDAASYLINPEYYAIKDMLVLVTNPNNAQ